MKKITFALIMTLLCTSAFAKGDNAENAQKRNVSANRECRIIVYENTDNPLDLTDGRDLSSKNRSLFGDIWTAMKSNYSSSVTGIISSASKDILTTGVGLIVEGVRSKKGDWKQQVMRDCKYTRQLPMPQAITEFYGKPSNVGPLDPENIAFNGIGYKQYLTYTEEVDGKKETRRLLVFDIKCSLRSDSIGKARMLRHGKFELVLDRLIINPMLCDLPNDSLTEKDVEQLRTPFDFERRKNLKISLTADITSSWVNEAVMITENQKLGSFTVNANIPNASYLETDGEYEGYFIYERGTKEKYANCASVVGESFLVPRSYIGTEDGETGSRTWGTGQYKVNMSLSESCDINMDFYYDKSSTPSMPSKASNMGVMSQSRGSVAAGKQKWNYHWSEEWKRIKRRRHNSKNVFDGIWNTIKMQYGNYRWINVIVDPVVTTTLNAENQYINKQLSKWLQLGAKTSLTDVSSSASKGTSTQQVPQQQGGGASQGGAQGASSGNKSTYTKK